MLDRVKRNASTNILQKDCLDKEGFLAQVAEAFDLMSFQVYAADTWKDAIEDDLRNIGSLRTKCKNVGLTAQIVNLLPVKGRFGINVRLAES